MELSEMTSLLQGAVSCFFAPSAIKIIISSKPTNIQFLQARCHSCRLANTVTASDGASADANQFLPKPSQIFFLFL